MRKNNRAARAERTYEQVRLVLCKKMKTKTSKKQKQKKKGGALASTTGTAMTTP